MTSKGSSLREEDVGITVFINPGLPGFDGILKQRYRDFQVREVDLDGQVARLDSLDPCPQGPKDGTSPDGTAAAAQEAVPFTPTGLAAARAGVVSSFSDLAGAENAALLDGLLGRVLKALGHEGEQDGKAAAGAGDGTGSGSGSGDGPGGGGAAAAAAGGMAQPNAPPQEAKQEDSGQPQQEVKPQPDASASAAPAAAEAAGGGAPPGKAGAPTHGAKRAAASEPIRILLHPVASKDVRKAIHEFFRSTPGLPPMRTETVSEPSGQGQGQQQGWPGQGSESERPNKRQKGDDGERGQGGWQQRGRGQRGRGPGRGWGRGGGEKSEAPKEDAPAPPSTRIEVVFDPADLEGGGHSGAGGRGRGRGGNDGGRGGRGRGGGRGGRGGRGGGGGWAGGENRFLRFVLYKENMDTQVALNIVAHQLYIKGGTSFGFAGTKDKRAITTQFVTAFKVSPHKLAEINPRLRNIRVGSFSYVPNDLKLGCLSGNEFHLLMRAVTGAAVEQVAAACAAVGRDGFINYFGLQRFGAGGAPTHEVGKAMLRGQYEEACRMVMTGREDERPEVAAARRLFLDKGDIKGCLAALPHHLLGERAVLGALARSGPSAWAAALLAVPRTLRMMYLHAWQSYVWNAAASHRISKYGHDKVVAGDLVLPRPKGAEGSLAADGGSAGDDDAAAAASGADEGSGGSDLASGATTSASRLAAVRLVTAGDVAAGRYAVTDVVLPLPGTQVRYPTHETGQRMRQVASEAGVDLDSAPTARAPAGPHRELAFASLTGDYRYLLQRPRAFSYSFRRYTDPNDDTLSLTDLEILQQQRQQQRQKKEEEAKPAADAHHSTAGDGEAATTGADAPGGEGAAPGGCQSTGGGVAVRGEGPLLALELRFQLPSSCYATMLLRELTKGSTSKEHHVGLSAAVGPGAGAGGEPAGGEPAGGELAGEELAGAMEVEGGAGAGAVEKPRAEAVEGEAA